MIVFFKFYISKRFVNSSSKLGFSYLSTLHLYTVGAEANCSLLFLLIVYSSEGIFILYHFDLGGFLFALSFLCLYVHVPIALSFSMDGSLNQCYHWASLLVPR